MKCSLIITTYNWPDALEVVLLSAFNQTNAPLEIIIADDGSNQKTKTLIKKLSIDSPIPIIHSWQEDKGFRAAMSRNKAIARAQGDYIILVDGDMILHRNFIFDHIKFAKVGFFVQGIRAKLNPIKANSVLELKQYIFSSFENGIKNKRNSLRSNLLSYIFSGQRFFRTLDMLQTCNMAFFKNDCISVNGFNEEFIGWGREDSDFAAKLLHLGIKRRDLRFKGIAYHIHHEGNSRKMLEKNHKIYLNTIKKKLTWSNYGINKYF
jgi:glycosyltransferase involved in cell wall biosynthesis